MDDQDKDLALRAQESIVETMFFEHSGSIAKITAALSKAQGVMGPAPMNCTANVQYQNKKTAQWVDKSYKYANLESVWDAIRKPLSDNGLAVVQFPSVQNSGNMQQVTVVTKLAHESGEYFGCTITLTGFDQKVHTSGSLMTYGRRYGISCLVGVVTEEDDDGEAGMNSGNGKQTQSFQPPQPPPPPKQQAQRRKKAVPQEEKQAPPPQEPKEKRWAGTPMNDVERGRLGLIGVEEVRKLGDMINKAGIPSDKWKKWLSAVYGIDTLYKMEKGMYVGVVAAVEKFADTIINFEEKDSK